MKILYSRTQAAAGRVSGGSVTHTLGVIDGLARLSELEVITNESLYGVDQLEQQIPVEIVTPVGSRGFSELLYNFHYPAHLSAKINKFRPDLVYHRFGGFSYATARVCKQLDVPLVLEFNNSPVRNLQQQAHSTWAKWSTLPKLAILKWIESYNLQAAFLVVVVSKPLKNYLLERGLPEPKIMVNPNAVNPEKFRPASPDVCLNIKHRLGIDPGKIVVGYAGSFYPWQGTLELAEAVVRLNSDPSRRQQLSFVLYGAGQLRPEVEKVIGHYENVLFAGRIEYAYMHDYLSICDILLSPHRKPPGKGGFVGSPTKIFEYMAMGKGIVASNLDQIGKVLQNGATAVLVPPGDVEALVQGICHLLDHPEEAERLGRNARRVVCERHTWEQNAQHVLDRFSALRAGG